MMKMCGMPGKAGETSNICTWYGGEEPQVTPAIPGMETTWEWTCSGANTLMAGIAGVTAYVSLM